MYTKLTLFLAFFFVGFINSGFGQCSAGQTSHTFSPSGAIEQWTVPDGVTAVTMIVTGADGGNSIQNGGSGATTTATFAVTAGEILDVVVGIAGGTGNVSVGGGGGGGSGVRRNSNSSILIIAGGGGGGNVDVINGYGGGGLSSALSTTFPIIGFESDGIGAGSVPGGFGAGGGSSGFPGSGPGIAFAGGGGGYPEGPSSAVNLGASGGFPFINSSNTSALPITAGVAGGGTESDGSVTFCFTQVQAQTPIPTMSQWGLMIFGLLTINLGMVFLRRKEEILA